MSTSTKNISIGLGFFIILFAYSCKDVCASRDKSHGHLYVGELHKHEAFRNITVIDFRWKSNDSLSVCEISSNFTGQGRGYSLSFANVRKDKDGKYFRLSYPEQLVFLKEVISYMNKEKSKDQLKRLYIQMSALGDASMSVSEMYTKIKPANKTYDKVSYQRALEESILISDISDIIHPYHLKVKSIYFELLYNMSVEDMKKDVVLSQANYPDTVNLCDDLCIELETLHINNK